MDNLSQRQCYLCHIQTTISTHSNISNNLLDFCLLNARSIRNKALLVKDYVVEHDIDVLALTETWLDSSDKDDYYVSEICPTGYVFNHSSRVDLIGGGVGFLTKKHMRIKKQREMNFKSYEYLDLLISYRHGCIRVVTVYRPPPSKENDLKEQAI